MNRGFTLLEVVVALLLLEVAVLAASGTLLVASRALREAEEIERAVVVVEGVQDSLAATPSIVDGSRPFEGGSIEWSVGFDGLVVVRASNAGGRSLLEVAFAPSAP